MINRKIVLWLPVSIVLFLLCSCNNNAAKINETAQYVTPSADMEGEALANKIPVKTDELYGDYSNRISNGLMEFRRLINSNEDFGPVSTLSIESRSVFGISAEGGQLTRFMPPEGNIVRYTFDIFGETGKSVHNYYYFNDGLVYIQILRMDYADWNFSADNRFDILQYSLNNYIIDDTGNFIIDDVNKQVIEAEEIQLYSLSELNNFFNDDY